MENEAWKIGIGNLQAAFGALSNEQLVFYTSMLKDIPGDVFIRGVANLIKNYEYTSFPKVGTIIKYCGLDAHSMAVKSIGIVKDAIISVGNYRSVDFNDRVLHAVIERFGGWTEVALWLESEWKFREKAFIESYESLAASGISGPEYLSGEHENYNRLHGYDKFIEKPRQLAYNNGKIRFVESKKQYAISDTSKKQITHDVESIRDIGMENF